MTTETIEAPVPAATDTGDQLIHAVCPRCHPLASSGGPCTALCGYTDTVARVVPYEATRACVVCIELRPTGCPSCGRT